MLEHLQKRLTFLCGITTSLILFISLLIVFCLSIHQENIHTDELFNKNVTTILDKLKHTNMISHNWLLQMEHDNNIIIYLEDQGYPLSFEGGLQTPTRRMDLINKVKALSLSEGFNTSINPFVATATKSSIFTIKENINETYRGIALLIPLDKGWRSVIVLQYLPNGLYQFLKKLFMFLGIGLMSSSILFYVSHLFISCALRPVAENHQRQVEFITAASHELRSPLSVLQLGIASLKENLNRGATYLPQLESECYRMNRLINDMLLLANSDARNWSLQMQLMDMDTFLIEIYDLFCPLASSHHQVFSLELPDDPLPKINGDPERLKQLLAILIDNAICYSKPNEDLTLRAFNYQSKLILELEDHGVGITDAQKDLIFNRFYRVDQSRKDKKHFGLGLSIAKELVLLHHGHIKIKDTPGGGATFVITLNLA